MPQRIETTTRILLAGKRFRYRLRNSPVKLLFIIIHSHDISNTSPVQQYIITLWLEKASVYNRYNIMYMRQGLDYIKYIGVTYHGVYAHQIHWSNSLVEQLKIKREFTYYFLQYF